MKLSTINQLVEAILGDSDFDDPRWKNVANEAVIYLKTAIICEEVGIGQAMDYFYGWHDENEYQEFRTGVLDGGEFNEKHAE